MILQTAAKRGSGVLTNEERKEFKKSLKGFQPCCSMCGQEAETSGYRAGLSYMHLCESCGSQMRGSLLNAAQNKAAKKENIVGGIVGAIPGSLVGVLKGYELLGGKLTRKGVVISVIV